MSLGTPPPTTTTDTAPSLCQRPEQGEPRQQVPWRAEKGEVASGKGRSAGGVRGGTVRARRGRARLGTREAKAQVGLGSSVTRPVRVDEVPTVK